MKIYPETKEDGWFFFKNSDQFSDADGKVTGWWIAGTKADAKLHAVVAHDPTAAIVLIGKVSTTPFRNLVPAPHLRYGEAAQTWRSIKVAATPVRSANATYFQLASWVGGYVGLQQTENQAKKLIFTIWRTAEGLPSIVEDNAANCELNENSAEGTFVQCITDYPWSVGNTYNFQVTATPIGSSIDYSLRVNDIHYYAVRVPVPAGFRPSMPAAVVEQFAHDQYSCLAGDERSIKIQASYTPSDGMAEQPITTAFFSRPYDTGYGHGSLCFNYAYGTLDELALPQAPIQPGFFISAGGNRLISEPADPAVGALGKAITLPLRSHDISTQADMDSLQQKAYFEETLARNRNLRISTSAGNWLPEFTLPEHVAEGSRFTLISHSGEATNIVVAGIKYVVAPGESASFIFASSAWAPQQEGFPAPPVPPAPGFESFEDEMGRFFQAGDEYTFGSNLIIKVLSGDVRALYDYGVRKVVMFTYGGMEFKLPSPARGVDFYSYGDGIDSQSITTYYNAAGAIIGTSSGPEGHGTESFTASTGESIVSFRVQCMRGWRAMSDVRWMF